jgi:hypothetical protein
MPKRGRRSRNRSGRQNHQDRVISGSPEQIEHSLKTLITYQCQACGEDQPLSELTTFRADSDPFTISEDYVCRDMAGCSERVRQQKEKGHEALR